MVAGMTRMDPGDNDGGILVRKDLVDGDQARDWPDLRGRVVAVPARGSVNDYALARGLQTGGLTLGDVELIELNYADMLPAFANGQIDAASFAAEPLPTIATERGLAARWRSVGDFVPGVSPNAMSFAPGFAQNQSDVGRRWMVAYLRGARDYAAARRGEGRADVIAILTKHTLVKDPALYERMTWLQLDPNGALNLANIADQTAWYAEQGLLQGPFDPGNVADVSFLDSALARLGPYRP
jgi:NitT/TauT family transport system substrate-binding protein